jgi:hypothetical protein
MKKMIFLYTKDDESEVMLEIIDYMTKLLFESEVILKKKMKI